MKKSSRSIISQLALAALALLLVPSLHAQLLSGFNFDVGTNTASATSRDNALGVTGTSLSLGSGLTYVNNFGNLYSAKPDNSVSLTAAEAAGDYINVTVTPTHGFKLTISSLNFQLASFGGATTLALTDSSEGLLGSVTAPEAANNGNHAYPGFNEPVALSLATPVTINSPTSFRLYLYGSGDDGSDDGSPYTLGFNSASTAKSDDSFVVTGTVALAPEPSTDALALAGALMLSVVVLHRRKTTLL